MNSFISVLIQQGQAGTITISVSVLAVTLIMVSLLWVALRRLLSRGSTAERIRLVAKTLLSSRHHSAEPLPLPTLSTLVVSCVSLSATVQLRNPLTPPLGIIGLRASIESMGFPV